MPVTLSYPGVYVEEIPSGVRSITGVATSITAFVGYTTSGPVNQPVEIFNFGDFQRNFGGLQLGSELGYAVQQFFQNGGSDAFVVRVAAGAAQATLSLGGIGGHTVLSVAAASVGAWGNSVLVEVDYQTANPDSLFNLTITSYTLQNGKQVVSATESYRNLSMNSLSSAYAPMAVNGDSQLITVADAGVSVTSGGWSLSKDLTTFPALTSQDTIISGLGDTVLPFTLVLSSVPSDITTLVTAIGNAITAAGLSAKLVASHADGTGHGTTGNFLLLTSKTAGPNSSVQILRVAANDVAAKLGLGLVNGGREREAASANRPLPNGTLSADLAVAVPSAPALAVTVTDRSSNTQLVHAPVTPAATTSLTGMRDAIQAAIRGIANSPATAQATVQLFGTFLSILPSATTPNASINLGVAELDAFENVQEYSVGTGATFNAQSAASPGSDGTPPGAADIIGDYNAKTGIYALRNVDLFNLLAIPRTTILSDTEALATLSAAMSFCEERRAFLIVDPNPAKDFTNIGDWVGTSLQSSRNAAVFFPRILAADPLQNFRTRPMPASGAIAGIFAQTDAQRGVWKAPAGIDAVLQGVQGLSDTVTDPENGVLNPLGINCLRTFAVYGSVVWGSRTLFGSDVRADEYKYVPVRRLALYLEETLYRGTQWVVFEPNDEPLWAQIRLNVGSFMQTLFRQGAFQGSTPTNAYFVKCDSETTTPADQNQGVVNILVGFAPLKPAEFVVIQLQQMAGQTSA
jgi:phage tail sheath protein FI